MFHLYNWAWIPIGSTLCNGVANNCLIHLASEEQDTSCNSLSPLHCFIQIRRCSQFNFLVGLNKECLTTYMPICQLIVTILMKFQPPPQKLCNNFFRGAQELVLVQQTLIMEKIIKKHSWEPFKEPPLPKCTVSHCANGPG